MHEDVPRVLWVEGASTAQWFDVQALATAKFGPFEAEHCAGLDEAIARLAERAFDAVLLQVGAPEAERLPVWPALSQATTQAAVVVWVDAPCDVVVARRLMQAGVQDVLLDMPKDAVAAPAELTRSLRLAIERKRIDNDARKAYATDLSTGLPNRQQLIEHMSQLLALRGREPAPMALLVLRVEAFDTVEAALGAESANVLRRKLAVRLRAAVRASDIVAALAADTFALLLASTEEPLDAERVANKLLVALRDPFTLAGQPVAVAASVGISHFPADGDDADVLMRQAVAAATRAHVTGRDGFVNWRENMWHETGAANDGDMD